jgi:lipopolysaccharide/colanic/teichoic acid biosynthesis glycosyltransferase
MKTITLPLPEPGSTGYAEKNAESNGVALHSYVWEAARDRQVSAFRLYRHLGKRVLDILIVLMALPFAIPLIAVFALMLRRQGNSAFFIQERVGQNGNRFRMVKMRTMVEDAGDALRKHLSENPEARDEWNRMQKLRHDPRITPVGHLMRRMSMDELPQLWNVLIGDMSLVGPRPMMPEQVPLYGATQSYVALRPGITGLWQVSARNEAEFVSRQHLDARYERDLSLMNDFRILLKTVVVVLRGTGQ